MKSIVTGFAYALGDFTTLCRVEKSRPRETTLRLREAAEEKTANRTRKRDREREKEKKKEREMYRKKLGGDEKKNEERRDSRGEGGKARSEKTEMARVKTSACEYYARARARPHALRLSPSSTRGRNVES